MQTGPASARMPWPSRLPEHHLRGFAVRAGTERDRKMQYEPTDDLRNRFTYHPANASIARQP